MRMDFGWNNESRERLDKVPVFDHLHIKSYQQVDYFVNIE